MSRKTMLLFILVNVLLMLNSGCSKDTEQRPSDTAGSELRKDAENTKKQLKNKVMIVMTDTTKWVDPPKPPQVQNMVSTMQASNSLFKDGSRFWDTGALVLFRADVTVAGETGKNGEVYKVDDKHKLQKIGQFNPERSDEDLINEYGIK